MKKFASLFTSLDQTTKTNEKVDALANYFKEAPEKDKLWAIAILSHKRPKRTVTTSLLRAWAAESSGYPLWLFEESYHLVGDLAETIALFLPPQKSQSNKSLSQWIDYLRSLKDKDESEKKLVICDAWDKMHDTERFVFNKLITGGFRMGVSQKLMTRALSKATGIDENKLAHRLMGEWTPDNSDFKKLILSENPDENISRPYPFYLAYALDISFEELGTPSNWQVERKWDGIRGQLIIRNGQLFVWSRGEELVTDKFPEYGALADLLPNGTVLDGEIIAFKDGKPLPFNILQTRIGRKKVAKKHLTEAPCVCIVYDLLEHQGIDIREETMAYRRTKLEELLAANDTKGILILSETLDYATWDEFEKERIEARENDCEGLMLKSKNSIYQSGRKRGDWWKWKVDPFLIDAVLLYAQAGHGRRANLFTDYTFAVWNGEDLVPFTKAYSGLKDEEFKEITAFVKKNTIERFGPVRSVQPKLVFEIAFEGINVSKRHKSGVALRFPRMKRWRKDKPVEEANTLEDLKALLKKVN